MLDLPSPQPQNKTRLAGSELRLYVARHRHEAMKWSTGTLVLCTAKTPMRFLPSRRRRIQSPPLPLRWLAARPQGHETCIQCTQRHANQYPRVSCPLSCHQACNHEAIQTTHRRGLAVNHKCRNEFISRKWLMGNDVDHNFHIVGIEILIE